MIVPEIPKSDYPERIEKVRRLMRAKNLDAVFVYHDELNMANGCYLTGYWPLIETGGVLVPLEGEPMLLGGPEAADYAREVSAIQTLRSVDVFLVPEEEYPGAEILTFPQVLKEASTGRQIKRLGMVGYDTIQAGVDRAIRSSLPGVEFVDLSRTYEVIRAVKSEAEIACERFAFEAGGQGHRSLLATVKPGSTELEVAAAGEAKMRALGIDGFNFRSLVGSGKRSNICVPPASTKKLQAGELMMVAFGPKCKGYTAGASCMYSVDGKPSDAQKRWMAAMANALRITRDALRPGAIGKELDAIPRKYLADLGYGPYCTMPFVHTIGLNEYERPFFGPNSEDKLEVNLTVCIDSSMFFHPTLFGGRVETGYVIRDGAPESLSKTLEDQILALI